ncbi:hypothetical protein BDW74DRAFT_177478 [Aspergillus multicolor]|uniref:alpha/beta fold hydrolase n=1 Tax=Aspergillus multicolor TaxID=41759 RepID=UPI003CCCCE14
MSDTEAAAWISKIQHQPANWDGAVPYCGWREVPSLHIVLEKDVAIPPEVQEQMAQMAGSRVVRLDTGHLAQLSRTDEAQQSGASRNEGSNSTPMVTVPPREAVTMESNSGAAFARRLGLMLDPANAPEPQLFAWNVGTRQLPGIYPALPLIEAISHAEMQVLAQIYFDKKRWLRPSTLEPTTSPPRTLTQPPFNVDPDTRCRLVAYVQYINTWISYGLGRSPVQLHGAAPFSSAKSISEREDYNAEMPNLLPVSVSLAPHKPADPAQLMALLVAVLDSKRVQPPSILSQCNLALCILRRLRALGTHADVTAAATTDDIATPTPANPTSTTPDLTSTPSSPATLTSRAISLSHKALSCAWHLAHQISPWSHVATMPFQIVYTMLAVDTPAATACLREAMDALKEIRDLYDSDVLREAYRAAGILVLLQQRKKEGEGRALRGIVEAHLSVERVGPGSGEGEGGEGEETTSGTGDVLCAASQLGQQQDLQRVEMSGMYLGSSIAEMQDLGFDEGLAQLFGGGGLGFVVF